MLVAIILVYRHLEEIPARYVCIRSVKARRKDFENTSIEIAVNRTCDGGGRGWIVLG